MQVELLSKTCLCSQFACASVCECVCVCKEVFLDSLAEQQSDVFRGDISSLCGYKFYAFGYYTASQYKPVLAFSNERDYIMVCILFLPKAGLSN